MSLHARAIDVMVAPIAAALASRAIAALDAMGARAMRRALAMPIAASGRSGTARGVSMMSRKVVSSARKVAVG